MIDRFGHRIELKSRVMIYAPGYGRYLIGNVISLSTYLISVLCDPDKSRNPVFRPTIRKSVEDIVVLNESDPRVTRFILENSV